MMKITTGAFALLFGALVLSLASTSCWAAPTVIFTDPGAGQANIGVNYTISARFSEAMDASTINGSSFYLVPATEKTIALSADGLTATLRPSSPLSYGTTYTATITTAVRSKNGAAMAVAKNWQFSTVQQPQVAVEGVIPSNGAQGVVLNAKIRARFNQAMDQSTITGSTFTVSDGTSLIPGTVTYEPATFWAQFSPATELARNKTYTASISTAAKAAAGALFLGQTKTWSFTTGDLSLTANIVGSGGGVVSAPGVSCIGTACTGSFAPGTVVNLTAVPESGSTFDGWGGSCSGTSATCTLIMDASKNVTATFTDRVSPQLVLSTLPDGAVTNNATLNVAGVATDNHSVKGVTLNDLPVAIYSSGDGKSASFSDAVSLVAGENVITTVAEDLAGLKASDVRRITLDTKVPELNITAPADNSVTPSATVTVTGTVDEQSTVSVKVNNASPQQAAINGTVFETTVNLDEGTNTINITATDLGGNSSSGKRTIIRDNKAPALAITNPDYDVKTSETAMTVSGTVGDDTPVTLAVTVDTMRLQPDPVPTSGKFQFTVPFGAEKTYEIRVTATDSLNNSSAATRNIIFTKPDMTGDGTFDIGDALQSLRVAVGLVTPTTEMLIRGDVAPLVNGRPTPDGKIDIGDVIVLLRKVVGGLTW